MKTAARAYKVTPGSSSVVAWARCSLSRRPLRPLSSPCMRFDIVTIFPGFFAGIFEHGIVRRAQAEGLVTVETHDLRNFTHDRHRTVDDRPFGGGEGMVLKPEPMAEAMTALGVTPKPREQGNEGTRERESREQGTGIRDQKSQVVLLSAQGYRPFTQAIARHLSTRDRVILVCGRYEGVDERINQIYCDIELSIGDYVLSGGELAAAVVIDAVHAPHPRRAGQRRASGEFWKAFGIADAEIATDIEGVPCSQHRQPMRPARLPALHPPRGVRGLPVRA